MSKKEKIIIVLFSTLILLGGVVFIFSKEKTSPIVPEKVVQKQINNVQTVLEIKGERYEDVITGSESVYDLMSQLRQEGKITFKEKNYSGMGKFIEEINGVKNSGEKNWIYYVNGKKANIGISNYKLINGDIVSWKYESQY